MLDFAMIEAARVYDAPYRFIAGEGLISAERGKSIRQTFPVFEEGGFLPLSQFEITGAFADLMADLNSRRLAEVLSSKLGVDLVDRPRMITLRRNSKEGDGRIHNDSESKISTMLVYLNESWPAGAAGSIRALNGPDDIDDYTLEVPPLNGNFFAFARSERSWHGHIPYAGERLVVQTTFLTSQEALRRKERSGVFQRIGKSLVRKLSGRRANHS